MDLLEQEDEIQVQALREWNRIHERKVGYIKRIKALRRIAKWYKKIQYTWWLVKIRVKYWYY